MKFKIYKETVVTKTNIFGKPVETDTWYYIYRPILFGLFRLYLKIDDCFVGIDNNTVHYFEVRYVPKRFATGYPEQIAKTMLDNIYSQPDKFIRKP